MRSAREVAAKGAIIATVIACLATTNIPPWKLEAEQFLQAVELTEETPDATLHFSVESSRPPWVYVTGGTSLSGEAALSVGATLTVSGGNDLVDYVSTFPDTDEEKKAARSSDVEFTVSGGPGGEVDPVLEQVQSDEIPRGVLRPDCFPCVNHYQLALHLAPTEGGPRSAAITLQVKAAVGGDDSDEVPKRAYVRVIPR